MSKSLKTIQTVFKVVKIVATVLFILTIVGGALSLLGLILALVFRRAVSIGALQSLVEMEGASFVASCYGAIEGIISCAGAAVLMGYVRKYCERELADGTPFTYDGAKKLFRLGIVWIIVPAAISVLVGFTYSICWLFDQGIIESSSTSIDITTGLLLLLVSCIFKHGAEIREQKQLAEEELERVKAEAQKEAEPTSEPNEATSSTPTVELTEE